MQSDGFLGKRCLVTGGAGFIGSHLISRLKQSGAQVLGIDSYNDYYPSSLKHYRVDCLDLGQSVLKLDVLDKQFEECLVDFSPEVVIHLAAQPGVRYSRVNPESYLQSNVIAFHRLIEAMKRTSCRRLLYASSSSVYSGDENGQYVEANRGGLAMNLYALTKRYNEEFAILNQEWLQSTGMRFFSVYGPFGRPDMAYFRLAAASLGIGNFKQMGDGNQKRDYTFIHDVVDAIMALIPLEKGPELINIGGGSPVSLNSLKEKIIGIMNSDFQTTVVEADKSESRLTKASTALMEKWNLPIPMTKIDDGLVDFCNWVQGIDSRNLERWISGSH